MAAAAQPAFPRTFRRFISTYTFTQVSILFSVVVGDTICQYMMAGDQAASSDAASEKELATDKSSTTLNSTKEGESSKSMLSRWIQPLHEKYPWWNSDRTRVMTLTAVTLTTPWNYFSHRLNEHLFPGRSTSAILKKVGFNGITSIVSISLLFTGVSLFSGKDLQAAKQRIVKDLPQTYIAGSLFWPIVSAINIRMLPLDYRAASLSVCGAIWNIYLSWQVNKQPGEKIMKPETSEMKT